MLPTKVAKEIYFRNWAALEMYMYILAGYVNKGCPFLYRDTDPAIPLGIILQLHHSLLAFILFSVFLAFDSTIFDSIIKPCVAEPRFPLTHSIFEIWRAKFVHDFMSWYDNIFQCLLKLDTKTRTWFMACWRNTPWLSQIPNSSPHCP